MTALCRWLIVYSALVYCLFDLNGTQCIQLEANSLLQVVSVLPQLKYRLQLFIKHPCPWHISRQFYCILLCGETKAPRENSHAYLSCSNLHAWWAGNLRLITSYCDLSKIPLTLDNMVTETQYVQSQVCLCIWKTVFSVSCYQVLSMISHIAGQGIESWIGHVTKCSLFLGFSVKNCE